MRRLTPVFLVSMLAAACLFAATYTVTNTNDSGAGSYREALTNANTNPGLDTIAFNYCPDGTSTRGQMAVFIVKTFNLQ